MIKRFLSLAARALALFGVVALLYFALGSTIFPFWFYELFWGGGLASTDYWMGGVEYWLKTPVLPLVVGGCLAITVVLIHRFRAWFWPTIDQLRSLLILGSITGIMFIAFIAYYYGHSTYGPLQQITTLNAALEQLRSTPPQFPTIQAPVDFQFIDRDRVQSLYNQIEPDLVEAQRSVGTRGEISGKLGLRASAGEAEVGGSKQNEANSTYKRVEFSPERQCLDVMNYLISHSQAQYYTDGSQWINRRVALSFQRGFEQIQSDFTVVKKERPKVPAPPVGLSIGQPPTKEEQEAAQQQLKQYEDDFGSELTSLHGMVFVDGEFTTIRSSDGNALLVERFSDRPRRVDFRFAAPSTPEISRIVSIGRTRLRVFGTVVKPLGDDGVIEVRPIAVF